MNKQQKEKLFLQQFPQLEATGKYFSKKYKKEYEETQAKVFLIFSKVIDKYDKEKASIHTYLRHQLRAVESQLVSEIKKRIKTESIDDKMYYNNGEGNKSYNGFTTKEEDNKWNNFEKLLSFYDSASTELSDIAQEILKFILIEPRASIQKKPTLHSIKNYFCKIKGEKKKLIEDAWNEIKCWWLSNRYEFA